MNRRLRVSIIHALEGFFPILLVILAGLASSYYVQHDDAKQEAWENFKRAHSCRRVGFLSGDLLTRDKTGWLCNDGITYWK